MHQTEETTAPPPPAPRAETPSTPSEPIEWRIHVIRGEKVILDSDLAELYQVATGNLNLAVKRNPARFPVDFMFQLEQEEFDSLQLQPAIAKKSRGGRRTLPYVFTELGVAMLSSVLNSERAIEMNMLIMRTFVKIRTLLAADRGLARHLDAIEARCTKELTAQERELATQDPPITGVFKALRDLIDTPNPQPIDSTANLSKTSPELSGPTTRTA